jgi:hypothetical protein
LQFLYDDTLDNALRIEKAMKREAQVLGEEPHEIPMPGVQAEDGGDLEVRDEVSDGPTERDAEGDGL